VKSRRKINVGSSQLRWVILLLGVAVVLPTVCVLWFIGQAVKNERLAVRQKLVNIYQEQLTKSAQKTNQTSLQRLKAPDGAIVKTRSYEFFDSLVTEDGYDGAVIYDSGGRRVFPLLSADTDKPIEPVEGFGDAWRLEFAEQRFAEAAELYEQKMRSYSENVRLAATIGKSRCLFKLGRTDEAIELCKEIALRDTQDTAESLTLVAISNARLLLLRFLEQVSDKYKGLFEETFERLVSTVYSTNERGVSLPADNNLFIAHKILELLREKPVLEEKMKPLSVRIRKLIAAEERSIRAAESFPAVAAVGGRQEDRFRRLGVVGEPVYGLYRKIDGGTLLLLVSQEGIVSALSDYENRFKDSDVFYRIVDDAGGFVAGAVQPEGKPFVTGAVGEHFGGWRVELYFKDGGIFEKAASRQVAVYTWAGVLVIVLILAAGGFAGQVVGRQIRLNRLKNDFIATVSHELKTPLASMRVLVDTLLEGSYKDQEQAAEYLQLTARENERLSRLIDNFLTFSRMERGKQAFGIVKTAPAEIAKTAAEAVRTKFKNGDCKFEISIDDNLPDISADRDAIVTVLVNLLDNAYKYTGDEKQIELRVFAEDDAVCFAVKDNGIGMSRRQTKRVFDRFYQADSSLSRWAEGTGLGLSIVKFIIDAHKGKISVESKPGKGSEFNIRLPVCR